MKFNKNILIAGAAIVSMAACQPEMTQPTDAEIDAVVATKVTEMKSSLEAECNKSILAMATAKADSIMVAAANKPQVIQQVIAAPAPAPAPKRAPAPKKKTVAKPVEKAPVKTNAKADKMSGKKQNTTQTKKDKMGGKSISAEKIKEATDKKKSKMGGK